MNNLMVFEKEELGKIRTIIKGADVWFVAKDVCDILEIKNVSDAINRLDDDEKADIVLNDISQNRNFSIINESGLYSLVLSSRKPEAKQFKKWITNEILPSIRKTGSYSLEQQYNIPKNYKEALMLMVNQEEKIEKLQIELQNQKPKIELYDMVFESDTDFDLANAAKLLKQYNLGRNTLIKILIEHKVLQKNRLPYQSYINRGLFEVSLSKELNNGKAVCKALATMKGIEYIDKILKKEFEVSINNSRALFKVVNEK